MIIDFILIIALSLLGLFWSNALKAREMAFTAAKTHCQKQDLQLLDEYVALNGLWLKRDEHGRIKAWRSYQFEFTSTGNERYQGKIIILGNKITSIELDPYRIEP